MNRASPGARLMPASAGPDAVRLLGTRALRGLVDGTVSVLLAGHLLGLGFTAFQVSAVVTATLLGSAALTLLVGLAGERVSRRALMLGACVLMAATGLGFATLTTFIPLLVVAVVGTLNPSQGDVSVFLPIEQAALPDTASAADRTGLFSRYTFVGNVAGAVGALVAGGLATLGGRATGARLGFFFYATAAVVMALVYLRLGAAALGPPRPSSSRPLARSRRLVLELTALFSLDAFGGGFVVQALLVLWLQLRFNLPLATAGVVFFAAGVLSAVSQLASTPLARRIGLINTMVFTHIPANLFLIAAALMPTAPLAIVFLLLRASLSQMDVPARQSFVMAVVPPEERAAAAGVTNVPRSLAAGLAPLIAGALLRQSSFGWPLICAGVAKIIYDLVLLARFRHVRPPEEGVSLGDGVV